MPPIKKKFNNELLFPELSYKICGLCFEAHNQLGPWRSERTYADFLEKLFKESGIAFKREYALPASFDAEMDRRNIVDFIIEDSVVLELKSKQVITKEDYYQVKRYLVSSNKRLGIIVNFRRKYLAPKRIIVPISEIY